MTLIFKSYLRNTFFLKVLYVTVVVWQFLIKLNSRYLLYNSVNLLLSTCPKEWKNMSTKSLLQGHGGRAKTWIRIEQHFSATPSKQKENSFSESGWLRKWTEVQYWAESELQICDHFFNLLHHTEAMISQENPYLGL
jgi:hypothetical protein